jgi:hypothetical protein
MTDSDLLAAVVRIFARHTRPDVFTNADHCCECAEHNRTLSSHTPESLSIEDAGQPGWDPICFATPAAFLYFFPGLVRLALTSHGEAFYLDQFVSHLSRRVDQLDAEERRIVHTLLWHLFEKFHDQAVCDDLTLWTLDDCLRKLEHFDSTPTEPLTAPSEPPLAHALQRPEELG